jgi:hypothetical protein
MTSDNVMMLNWLACMYFVKPSTRIARWYIFKPKIPIWANFWWSFNGTSILWPFDLFFSYLVYLFYCKIWYKLWSFGINCGHLVYFLVIWYVFWSFTITSGQLVYFSALVHCIKKDLPSIPKICQTYLAYNLFRLFFRMHYEFSFANELQIRRNYYVKEKKFLPKFRYPMNPRKSFSSGDRCYNYKIISLNILGKNNVSFSTFHIVYAKNWS